MPGISCRGHHPVGLLALVPQVVDATGLPVIAAGGIADARGVAAAIALGAAAVQVGTAYLRAPESRASDVHRAASTPRPRTTACSPTCSRAGSHAGCAIG